jgi:putative nucleotidyltransferase with HDIG domain
MAAAFATAPATAALVGLATVLAPGSWRGPVRSLFNAAQESLYTGLASVVFLTVRGALGAGAHSWIAAASAAASIAVLVNHTLVSGALAIDSRRTLADVWRALLWTAPHSFAFAFVALLVAIAYKGSGAPAAVLILTPIVVLRHARRAKMELEIAYDRTLRAFVRTVELKDPYTSRHSERVATIAVELHRALGATGKELERCYHGALLHDLGKVAVPARVLGKPGPLTRDEFEMLKRHPLSGAMVVSQVEFLKDVVPEVLYHHERIDGAGYPEGLAGDAIPYSARVLAVADTFEALTADRPYRRALSVAEAIAEIRRVAGTQLDSRPVSALVELLATGHAFPALAPRIAQIVGAVESESAAREA